MLILAMILNSVDILMIFLLTHAIIKQIPIFTWDRVLFGIGYGASLGIAAYFLDSYTYRIITTIGAFIVIYLVAKSSFSSAFLIYALTWFFGLIQFIVILGIQQVSLEQPIFFLLVQAISLVIVLIACRFRFLNIAFRFIEEHIELKLAVFVVGIVLIGALFYFNFQERTPYLVYFISLMVTFIVASYIMSAKIIHLRYKMPLKKHSDYHLNLGRMIQAYEEEDHKEIDRLKELSPDDVFALHVQHFQFGKTKENIIQFIKNKRALYNPNLEVRYEIFYSSEHKMMKTENVIKMLSILLDNAFETGTTNPIIVELSVTKSYIQLTVGNEFTSPDSEELSRIFTVDGYTTKKVNERGYGLTNLHNDLVHVGGKLMTNYQHDRMSNTPYLNITVKI